MREKVANAICQQRYGENIDDEVYISPSERGGCYRLADAAIAVILAELETPSLEMANAVQIAYVRHGPTAAIQAAATAIRALVNKTPVY